ncbi:MAG: hypothetical protein CYPHOPRED_004922 [Cyphobasidiales sp. Tagirdzhanova-0007]|nr:MAG: hypothetical protein CYPHOPRED_004922 [Cyphobasidiales sp. Tagirdzhanova-0007]
MAADLDSDDEARCGSDDIHIRAIHTGHVRTHSTMSINSVYADAVESMPNGPGHDDTPSQQISFQVSSQVSTTPACSPPHSHARVRALSSTSTHSSAYTDPEPSSPSESTSAATHTPRKGRVRLSFQRIRQSPSPSLSTSTAPGASASSVSSSSTSPEPSTAEVSKRLSMPGAFTTFPSLEEQTEAELELHEPNPVKLKLKPLVLPADRSSRTRESPDSGDSPESPNTRDTSLEDEKKHQVELKQADSNNPYATLYEQLSQSTEWQAQPPASVPPPPPPTPSLPNPAQHISSSLEPVAEVDEEPTLNCLDAEDTAVNDNPSHTAHLSHQAHHPSVPASAHSSSHPAPFAIPSRAKGRVTAGTVFLSGSITAHHIWPVPVMLPPHRSTTPEHTAALEPDASPYASRSPILHKATPEAEQPFSQRLVSPAWPPSGHPQPSTRHKLFKHPPPLDTRQRTKSEPTKPDPFSSPSTSRKTSKWLPDLLTGRKYMVVVERKKKTDTAGHAHGLKVPGVTNGKAGDAQWAISPPLQAIHINSGNLDFETSGGGEEGGGGGRRASPFGRRPTSPVPGYFRVPAESVPRVASASMAPNTSSSSSNRRPTQHRERYTAHTPQLAARAQTSPPHSHSPSQAPSSALSPPSPPTSPSSSPPFSSYTANHSTPSVPLPDYWAISFTAASFGDEGFLAPRAPRAHRKAALTA